MRVFLCKYFEFYARGEKIPFDQLGLLFQSNIQIARFILLFEVQKEQILTSVDTLGIKTGVVSSSSDHGICASPADVDRTVVAASSQDISSPLADHTCDSQEDACKDASPTGVCIIPSSLDRGMCASPMDVHKTVVLSRYIFPNLNGIMAEVIRVNDKSPIDVISSFLDHCICASLADADRTDVAASSQDTSSPLDDHTCNFQVDACKDTSPTGVGVVLSSPYRGICASP
ncbi:hypothetical protein KY285_010518 [Solanum tuberosum]|nr:hypothetical protein KY289_011060 [Solanum tuberosum]KAH0734811.1 hypothetical protein KY285_010518 [Solanum tuberosum]